MTSSGRHIDERVRWRTPTLLALSIALHLLVLSPLALRLFGPAFVDRVALPDLPIDIQMEPRPLLPGEARRTPVPPADRTRVAPGPPVRATASTPSTTGATSDETSAPGLGPSLPAPRTVAQTPPDAPAPTGDGSAWPAVPRDTDLAARIGASLGRGTGGCRNLSGATPEQRAACDQTFADVEVGRVTRTDNPRRDAQFAALGNQALAEYESRRAPIKPHSRANPCPHTTDIMGRCPVQFMVPLWSSNDGFLPGLKRD